MTGRILLNKPNHKNIGDVIKKIREVTSSDLFENGKLKGFREYLTKQNILITNNGVDQIDRHNLSCFLDKGYLLDWNAVLVKPFIDFKPDFLLYNNDHELKEIVKKRFNSLGHKTKEMFTSIQGTEVGDSYALCSHDKDGVVRYELDKMDRDRSIKGKTGLLVTTYLNKQETIGIIRAAKNAGGDIIGACAMFSVNGFKPNYAITLEDLK